MRSLLVVLALALQASALLPSVRTVPRRPVALSPGRRRTFHMSTTMPEAPAASSVPADETFKGVGPCPFTQWGPRDVSVEERSKPSGEFAPEWRKEDLMAADASVEDELNYFRSLRPDVKSKLHQYGAIILRGFELTKTSDGFQRMYLALGLDPCDDPLSSVAARDAVDKDKGVYEAVNKESRSKYFVCFKAADEGGEFLLADGRKLFRELDEDFVEAAYEKEVRFIAAELPLGFMDALHPGVRSFLEEPMLSLASMAAKKKVDFDIDLIWSKDTEGESCIHVIAPAQPPVVRHPETGEPVWFCNVHSHSDYLRVQREERDGTVELSKTTGSSRLNRTDIRFGDFSKFSQKWLDMVDRTVMDNLKWVKMSPGDVVLLDNYMTLHGRNIFSGVRKHAVTWFK